jgi:putative FmdB family regulatory protein
MPVYEFECDNCGIITEEFYRAIPRIVPTHSEKTCEVCKCRSHKKVLSLHAFHLKGGKVPWGEGRYSSAAPSGDTPVSITEPDGPITR